MKELILTLAARYLKQYDFEYNDGLTEEQNLDSLMVSAIEYGRSIGWNDGYADGVEYASDYTYEGWRD